MTAETIGAVVLALAILAIAAGIAAVILSNLRDGRPWHGERER